MPRSQTVTGPVVTKVTTVTREEGSSDAQVSPFYDRDFWEIIETFTEDEWRGHMARVYRSDDAWSPGPAPAENKLKERFDEEYIRNKWGGGRYLIWLYGPPDGTKLVRKFRVAIEGAPKYAAGSNSAGGDDSTLKMLFAELLAELRASRGTGTTQDAMKGALELQAAALRSGVETVRAINPLPAPQTSRIEALMDKFMEAMMMKFMSGEQDPLQRAFQEAMIKRLTDPVDPITSFQRMAEAVKTISPGGSNKTDFGAVAASFVQTLPTIIEKGFDGVRDYRLANESAERTIRLQTGHGLGTGEVLDATPPPIPPPAAAAPSPAAAPNPQVVEVQGPTVEWVQLRIVQTIEKDPDATGEALYDFLNAVAPELNDQLGVHTAESLMSIFKSQPILAKVAGNPRLPKIIEQYLAYFKEQAAASPA